MHRDGAADADSAQDSARVEVVVVVHVVRTGGFAGLTREWTAQPPPAEASRWVGLIEECPWEAAASAAPRGADRFAWRISARRADDPPRRAELTDDELQGPWRELVDEVRAFGAPPDRERARD